MEFKFEESIAVLRSLLGSVLNHLKNNSDTPFQVTDYIKTPEDCQDLLAVVGYLEQTSETLRTPLAKSLLSGEVVLQPNDKIVIQHPQYQALYRETLAQRNTLEKYQNENPDIATVAKALAESETQRAELMHRVSHLQASNKDALTAIGAEMSQIKQEKRDMEAAVEALKRENAALAKSRGNKVDAIHEELETLRTKYFMQTEKMHLLEDQNRQTLMILASEMSALKEKLALYESDPKSNETLNAFSEIAKTKDMLRHILIARDRKREIVEQMIASKVDDTVDAINKVIAEKKAELDKQKQEMAEKARIMSQKANEQEILIESVDESKKQVEILDQAIKDVEESIKAMKQERNSVDQQLKERVDALDIKEQESTEQMAVVQGLAAENKKIMNQIQQLEQKISEGNIEMEKLEQEFMELSNNRITLNAKISEVSAKSSELNNNVQKKLKEIEDAQATLNECMQKREEAENNLNHATTQLAEKMQVIDKLRRDVSDLDGSVQETQEQIQTTDYELNDVMKQNETVLEQLRNIKDKVRQKFNA